MEWNGCVCLNGTTIDWLAWSIHYVKGGMEGKVRLWFIFSYNLHEGWKEGMSTFLLIFRRSLELSIFVLWHYVSTDPHVRFSVKIGELLETFWEKTFVPVKIGFWKNSIRFFWNKLMKSWKTFWETLNLRRNRKNSTEDYTISGKADQILWMSRVTFRSLQATLGKTLRRIMKNLWKFVGQWGLGDVFSQILRKYSKLRGFFQKSF